jgi:hypothetical protein
MNHSLNNVDKNPRDANSKILAIEELATERGNTGGLVKRIDENRELLELLQERVPQFVSSHPWLVGWIQANDNFFTQLEDILETRKMLFTPSMASTLHDYPRRWPALVLVAKGEPLFKATPTSSSAQLNPLYETNIEAFLTALSKRVGSDVSLCWRTYRVKGYVCFACDIHGSHGSLKIMMTITGATVIPEGAEDDFDLWDAADAWCLLSLISDRFGVKFVAPIGQGLQISSSEILTKHDSSFKQIVEQHGKGTIIFIVVASFMITFAYFNFFVYPFYKLVTQKLV